MVKSMSKIFKRLPVAAVILLLLSCGDLFHQFRSVGTSWSQCDTLAFTYPSAVDVPTRSAVDIELRNNDQYPYKEILLRIELRSQLLNNSVVDTLLCQLYSDNGTPQGSTAGILRQTSFPLDTIDILPNDTLTIKVSHLMCDDNVRGISDVGIRFLHCGRHQL